MAHGLDETATPYAGLTPDTVLDALEGVGFRPDGSLLALNSYENRVYQARLEDHSFCVAKFYRPRRWSDAAILDEHAFAAELAEREIPVVAPLADAAGETLHFHQGFRFAVYPRRGGRWPELEDPEVLLRLGRLLGRIHAVGAARPFSARPRLDIAGFGEEPVHYLLEEGLVDRAYRDQYHALAEQLLDAVRAGFERAGAVAYLRLHGDCHAGNILWTDAGAHFVDLDDCRSGPAVQDLWMLLSGDRRSMTVHLSDLLEGYEEFFEFDRRELHLVEPLRALRLINYAAWLARRRDDPAFQQAFPWFASARYWEEQVLTLREQLERMQEPPLRA